MQPIKTTKWPDVIDPKPLFSFHNQQRISKNDPDPPNLLSNKVPKTVSKK